MNETVSGISLYAEHSAAVSFNPPSVMVILILSSWRYPQLTNLKTLVITTMRNRFFEALLSKLSQLFHITVESQYPPTLPQKSSHDKQKFFTKTDLKEFSHQNEEHSETFNVWLYTENVLGDKVYIYTSEENFFGETSRLGKDTPSALHHSKQLFGFHNSLCIHSLRILTITRVVQEPVVLSVASDRIVASASHRCLQSNKN